MSESSGLANPSPSPLTLPLALALAQATSAASHGLPSVRSDPSSGASQPPSAADPAASPTAKLATGDNSSHAQFPASIEAV